MEVAKIFIILLMFGITSMNYMHDQARIKCADGVLRQKAFWEAKIDESMTKSMYAYMHICVYMGLVGCE